VKAQAKRTRPRARNGEKAARRPKRIHPAKGSFFAPQTIDEMAREQGVHPLTDTGILAGAWPEDVDIDAFLKKIYDSR
jgi:hypothetical protein